MSEVRPERGEPQTADLLCREAPGQPFRPVSVAGDRLRIGRRFENDLVLSHASVSRFHAEVLREGSRWVVADCGSKFGTSLNGEPVIRAELSAGDEIRIGGDDGPLLVFSPAREVGGRVADPRVEEPAPAASDTEDTAGAISLVEQFRATTLIGDYREALTLVADAVLELTHFAQAALFLTDYAEAAEGALRAEIVRVRSGGILSADGARESAFVRAALATGGLVSVAPESRPEGGLADVVALARSAGIARALCVPLRTFSAGDLSATGEAHRVTIGALYLEGDVAAPPITDRVREAVESLAGEAGLVAERLRARQVSIVRVTARQAAAAERAAERAADLALSPAERARATSEYVSHLLVVGRFDKAAAALEPYENAATRAQLPETARAEVLRGLGLTLAWQGRWHRAAGILNAALDAAVEGQDSGLEMAIRSNLARAYSEIGEPAIAREHALTAVSVLRRTDETSMEYARALLTLGVLEQEDGDSTSAAHTFRLAARVAEEAEDLLSQASAYYRLGVVNNDRGNTSEAISSFQRMFELAQPLGNRLLLLLGQRALAACLVRSGAWSRAEAVIAAGLGLAEREKHDRAAADLLLLGAKIAARRHGAQAGARAIARVREAAAKAPDRAFMVEVDLLDAELRLESGDFAGARAALASAAGASGERGDLGVQARVHLLHAEVERRSGNLDAADRHVGQAQRLLGGNQDLALAGAVQRAVGCLNAERGRFAEAQHSLAQSLSIFRTVDDRRQIATVHLDLGNLMLAAGDPAYARTHLQNARTLFDELGIVPARDAADEALKSAIASVGADAPASYSSVLLAASSEPRFVRRLLEASQSRALLLRELTAIAIDVARAASASVVECGPTGGVEVVALSGDERTREVPMLSALRAARGEVIRGEDITFYPVEPASQGPETVATVLAVGTKVVAEGRADRTLMIVAQLARQGLELIALRTSLKRADLPDPVHHGTDGSSGVNPMVTSGLIYASQGMRKLAERLQRIRTSFATVLITGESGVGKELVARAIHAASQRPRAPFVPYNCSAAPRELIESQLFGHRRGAFTGATSDNPGMARAARNGTLFLDEVGDLPLEVQPKLLRFLESGEIQPLGESAPLRVEVRVVAATNAELERAVEERRFREDLFHRLNIIRLHVPPLRDRPEDIPLLVSHFLSRSSERAGYRRPPSITEGALGALLAYAWPGNVRQLRNEVERLVTFSPEGTTITRDALSEEIQAVAAPQPDDGARSVDAAHLPLPERLRQFEIEHITQALAGAGMNLTRAANSLGMARQNLQRRIKKLGLKEPEN